MSDYIELHVCTQPEIALEVREEIVSGGGGITPSGTKTINVTSNGTTTEDVTTYASAQIVANVPNTYAAGDEGKVVENGALVSQGSAEYTSNGTYDTTKISSVEVSVSGSSPSGTKEISISQNGTTTENVAAYASAEITVNVPNTYSAGDEGKVVSSGALVSQTSATYTTNNTYDTTLVNSVTVNVSGGTDYGPLIDGSISGAFESDVTSIVQYGLYDRDNITSIKMLNLGSSATYAFGGCGNLETIVIPSCKNLSSNVCRDCPKLTAVEFYGSMTNASQQIIGASAFSGDTVLKMVVIRATSVTGIMLYNTNAFNSSPFASSGSGGTLYVPNSLISTYQSASNWSTILGYANNQIKSIESTHTDPTAPIDLTLYHVDGSPIS